MTLRHRDAGRTLRFFRNRQGRGLGIARKSDVPRATFAFHQVLGNGDESSWRVPRNSGRHGDAEGRECCNYERGGMLVTRARRLSHTVENRLLLQRVIPDCRNKSVDRAAM